MKWDHHCPRCGNASVRYSSSAVRPTCRHEYHDAADCGVCGDCRNRGVVDIDGRWLAPPQTVIAERAAGPWNTNKENR